MDTPKVWTPQGIIAYLESETESDYERAYTFGHSVIDDYNLSDDSIDFCLQEVEINKWIKLRLESVMSRLNGDLSIDQLRRVVFLHTWTTNTLYLLKSIPEEIRLAAMDWYQGLDD